MAEEIKLKVKLVPDRIEIDRVLKTVKTSVSVSRGIGKATGPFAAYAAEKTKVGKIHLDPGPTISVLKKWGKLWKMDLYWRWIKGTWNILTKYVPLLGNLSDMFSAAIGLILTGLLMPFLPDIISVLKTLLEASASFFKWMKDHGPQIRFAVGISLKGIAAMLGLEGIIKAFGFLFNVLSKVSPLFAVLKGVLGYFWKILVSVLEKLGLKGFEGVLKGLIGFLAKIIDPLLWINLIASLLHAVLAWALGEDNPITKFVGVIAEVTDVIGWLIAAFKDLLAIFGVGKGGALSEKLGGIKKLIGLQSGGIVTSPTPAIIGEKGPEAVIPLNQMGGMGGTNVNVYIDGEKFRGMIRQEIQSSNRRLNNVRGSVGI